MRAAARRPHQRRLAACCAVTLASLLIAQQLYQHTRSSGGYTKEASGTTPKRSLPEVGSQLGALPNCPAHWAGLYFIHIPKTAGSFLTSVLEKGLEEHGTPASPNANWCSRLAFANDSAYNPQACTQFAKVAQAVFPHNCSGLGAHHNLALFEQLMTSEEQRRMLGPTLLRHPVERMVSEYFYVRQFPDFKRSLFGDPNSTDYAGLLAYATVSPLRCNWMTVTLGSHNTCPGGLGALSTVSLYTGATALLEAAKANLERLCWFGIQERMEDSLELLKGATGWPSMPSLPAINVNSHHKVPQDILDMIAETMPLDMALYQHALQLFERRVERWNTHHVGMAL